jgi:hypothetical protein
MSISAKAVCDCLGVLKATCHAQSMAGVDVLVRLGDADAGHPSRGRAQHRRHAEARGHRAVLALGPAAHALVGLSP